MGVEYFAVNNRFFVNKLIEEIENKQFLVKNFNRSLKFSDVKWSVEEKKFSFLKYFVESMATHLIDLFR